MVRKYAIVAVVTILIVVVECQDISDGLNGGNGTSGVDQVEGRTYTHHVAKRLSLLMLPLMFKLGVIMSLLVLITFLSANSLLVGIVLMVVGVSHVLARSYSTPSVVQAAPSFYRSPIPIVSPGVHWERRNMKVPSVSSDTAESSNQHTKMAYPYSQYQQYQPESNEFLSYSPSYGTNGIYTSNT